MIYLNVLTAPEVGVGRLDIEGRQTPVIFLNYPTGLITVLHDLFLFPEQKPIIEPGNVIVNVAFKEEGSRVEVQALCLNLSQPILFESVSDLDLGGPMAFRQEFERQGRYAVLIAIPTLAELGRPLGRIFFNEGQRIICLVECTELHIDHPDFGQLVRGLINRRHIKIRRKSHSFHICNN